MIQDPFSLRDKTILVTGASSGLGRAIAIACSQLGGSVVLSGRNEKKLEQTYSSLIGEGHTILTGDLTKEDDIERIANTIQKVDGIVHCAGIGQKVFCRDVTSEDFAHVISSNLRAPILLQKHMLSSKKINKSGSIVFLASYASEAPSVGNALYSASKGGIISYAKCLALELAPRNIRVNCISPAMVWTDLIRSKDLTDEDLHIEELKYPLRRYAKPDDIAYLAVYLLSDVSSWMTGSVINITGGTRVL